MDLGGAALVVFGAIMVTALGVILFVLNQLRHGDVGPQGD